MEGPEGKLRTANSSSKDLSITRASTISRQETSNSSLSDKVVETSNKIRGKIVIPIQNLRFLLVDLTLNWLWRS